MIKIYENVNPNKLVDELQGQGLLEKEKMAFFPKDNGLKIRFVDIKEVKTDILDENEEIIDTQISYQKKSVSTVTEVNEETGEETPKEVIEWLDYDFTVIDNAINQVVANHDPTPLEQPLSKEEKLQAQIDELTEILVNNGVIY